MNTKLIIIIGLVVVAGIAGFYFMSGQAATSVSDNNMMNTDDTAYGRLMSMFESGDSLKCAVSYDTEGEVGSGTFYMSGNDESFRGDFNITWSGDEPMVTHVLAHQGFIYTWLEGDSHGMKMKMESSLKDTVSSSLGNVSMQEHMDIDCDSWTVDSSLLTPPTNVSFVDATSYYQETGAEGAMSAQAQQCQACDMAGDASTAASCRAAMGCQ